MSNINSNNLNKVQFTTDADRYEVTLPVMCNFILEKTLKQVDMT